MRARSTLLVCLAACSGEVTDGGGESGLTDGGAFAADAAPDATPCAPVTYRLAHLQASMQRTDPGDERAASMSAAFDAGADTISWTEIENLSDMQYIQARDGWTTFWPSGSVELLARNAVPISWRTDTWELERGEAWLASEGMAEVSPSRWVTRVWLRHIASGQIVSRMAHHSVSGVDGDGKPPVEWRREMHAKNIAKFREVILLDTVPVIGSADFNTTTLRDLLGSSFEYDVPASGGTHGTRLIDWVVRRPHPDHQVVDSKIITLGFSDHRGVRARYDFTPSCQ